MQTVTPFLMFEGTAEEAMRFYAATLPRCEIRELTRWGDEMPGAVGKVLKGLIAIDGTEFRCFDSPAPHAFGFTPAISLFVRLPSAAEVDRVVAALSAGGSVLMPLDRYPFSERYAWVNDRFGVSWQLSLEA